MEPMKVYQYTIPCGLRVSEYQTDSPTRILDLLKNRRISPFSIADILGLHKNESEEQILKKNGASSYMLHSLLNARPRSESPNSCTSDDRGYESSVDEPKVPEQNPIILSTSRSRVAYSSNQVRKMENVFNENQYPDVHDREELARVTGLSEHQVKIWFQNRRQKIKKHLKTAGSLDSMPPVPRVLISPSTDMIECPILSRGGFAASEYRHTESHRRRKRSQESITKNKGITNSHTSVLIDPNPVSSSSPYCYSSRMEVPSNRPFKRYQPYNTQPASRRRNSSGASQEDSLRAKLPQKIGISIY